MTDRLDPKSRKDLIEYKVDKALQTVKEAELLAGSNFYNAAVNRLYYSAYYAASALMLRESIETVTHKGIRMMLGLKFIQTGKLNREYGKIYQRLFESRQAGDYEDFVYYDKETFDELLPGTIKFIDAVKNLLH
ncbi:MAG: HEPN domain-containing protein [Muribaculaceae bacterium]|nr:HEPN domain-containing protein [Muribaculaceae bacterium]